MSAFPEIGDDTGGAGVRPPIVETPQHLVAGFGIDITNSSECGRRRLRIGAFARPTPFNRCNFCNFRDYQADGQRRHRE